MEQERRRIAHHPPSPEGEATGEFAESTLLASARGWAGAAREIHEEIDKGKDAVQRVERRHNTSGQ